MLGMDPEVAFYYKERQEKQDYLVSEIQQCNYNVAEFAQFLDYKREKGTDVDSWTFQELVQVVQEFKSTYMPVQNNDQQQIQDQQFNQNMGQNSHRQTFAQMVSQEAAGQNQNSSFNQDFHSESQLQQIVNDYENEHPQNHLDNQMNQLQFEEKKGSVDFEVIPQTDVSRKLPQRQFIDTKKIQDNPTPLNFKRIDIRVNEGLIKDGGIFTANYITYKIETAPLGYEVRRKDADFMYLRKILTKGFPHIIIPPLPQKAPKPVPKYIKKREKYYQRFLQAVARSEELKSSQFLLDFLFEQDLKAFQKIMKDLDKAKYPRQVEEFVTYKGQAKVQMTTNSSAFCTKMVDYADSYQILYKEMIDCAKEINEKSQELASTMFQLHKFTEQMSELNRMIKCNSQHELFAWLSKMITGSGNFIAQQGELIEKYVGEHMKFHLDEHESFRELFTLREKIKQEYVRIERALIDKKEKLFKTKDVYKWGGFQDNIELLKLKDDLLKDKDKSFQYMLPKETKEVELKREELCFYTNQCWDEIRRVGNDNGKLIRDHFRDMSQIQCSYINQNHVMWADFLSHFAELAAQDVEQERIQQQQMMQQNIKFDGEPETRDGGSGGTGRVV